MTDPIADMIVRIQNAGAVHKESVLIPYSKLKWEICTVLEKEGYIKSVAKKGKKVARFIEVGLLYNGRDARVSGVKRISKPSRRLYEKATSMRPVKNGYGASIISTPKGIMTGLEARKTNVGGEVLFNIW